MSDNIPQKYRDLVGHKHSFSGTLLNYGKAILETEFDVLDIRWGSAQVMDMKTFKMLHPTFELLVKNKTMKRAQWTKGFPIREITLEDEEE